MSLKCSRIKENNKMVKWANNKEISLVLLF